MNPVFTAKAVLFDLDGTLADTAPDLAAAVNRMRAMRNLEPAPYENLRPFASAGARGLLGAGFGITPQDDGFEAMRVEFLNNYENAICVHSKLFPGVDQLLSMIAERDLDWGIVTNKAARFTQALLPLLGLRHAACVVSGDTTPYSKPRPEPLLEAARQLDIAPQDCVYIGDDLRDIQAAHAAGMFSIAAAWGYCGHTEPTQWQANLILQLPETLFKFIA
jgi:N-acetyl-D-muramate 6-phosphate phosphatase